MLCDVKILNCWNIPSMFLSSTNYGKKLWLLFLIPWLTSFLLWVNCLEEGLSQYFLSFFFFVLIFYSLSSGTIVAYFYLSQTHFIQKIDCFHWRRFCSVFFKILVNSRFYIVYRLIISCCFGFLLVFHYFLRQKEWKCERCENSFSNVSYTLERFCLFVRAYFPS